MQGLSKFFGKGKIGGLNEWRALSTQNYTFNNLSNKDLDIFFFK